MSKFNEFVSSIKNTGLAKSNYFEVLIPLPNKLITNAQDIRTIQLFCEATQLPGISISTNQQRIFGEPRETPYEKLYENITLTFYVDANMAVKYFFDRWFNIIQDKDSRTFSYYNDYISPVVNIIVVDKKNAKKYAVNLYECYPKAMGAVTLDQSNKEAMRVEISLNYKYWESVQYGTEAEANTTEEIPNEYFREFEKFQTDVTDIVGGITRDIREAVAKIPNQSKVGDNLNNDFIGLI